MKTCSLKYNYMRHVSVSVLLIYISVINFKSVSVIKGDYEDLFTYI